MTERPIRHENEETDRARLEVVHLLRSILEEVTIQAQGRPRPLSRQAQAAIQLFEQLGKRIELVPVACTLE
jgi:hypothetical protein